MLNLLIMKRIEQNSRRWRINTNDLSIQKQDDYQQQFLPDNAGTGYTNFYNLNQDLNFIETKYTPTKDISLLSQIDNDESKLVVTLGIKGHSRYVDKQGNEVNFNEGFTTITSFSSSTGERQYEANKEVLQMRFVLSKSFFTLYFGEKCSSQLFKKNDIHNLSFHPITPQGLIAAHQILVNNIANKPKHLFMHGQALTLLASELSPLFNEYKDDVKKFNQNDKEIAKTAKDILFTEFKTPPSVADLSKRVGTNQLKLKKLFHHFFNSTPYGLLLEIRMNKAYQLLESSHCHVNVAADFVGYTHASNFSAAFVKFFGISPKYVSRKKIQRIAHTS